eukprot:TRINITY_DN10293_c0_g1_i1.p1 TRINITY_DN10293_c0_g1~~TRINITY_DN10293_c0_g1_i1.p1  ORF type:complete len:759 (-),score=141.26 TRINITY_DN10293_c0_g1_i1:150-2426(-)
MEEENQHAKLVALLKDSLCGECDKEIATINCKDCSENYCKDCSDLVHKKGRRKQHTQFAVIRLCGKCEAAHAQKECLDCRKQFCDFCCEEVHKIGKEKQHKYIKPVGTHLDVIDLKVTNAMGIPLAELKFERGGDLAPHVKSTADIVQSVGGLLRTTTEYYVDPDPVTLDVSATVLPSRISQRVQSEETQLLHERQLQDHKDATSRKLEEIQRNFESAPLKPVHSWRRSFLVVPYPCLFGEGNTVLESRPENFPEATSLIKYAPCFQKGIYDDEYFLLALSQVATNREALKHLFLSCEYHDVGTYVFQFYQTEDIFHVNTGWQCVVVDDLVPCNGEMKPIFGMTKDPNEMWALLVEKAYAKFLGSYCYLHSGDHARAMVHLTGGVTYTDQWDPKLIDGDAQSILWWKLKENSLHGLFTSAMKYGGVRPRPVSNQRKKTGNEAIEEGQTSLRRVDDEYLQWNASGVIVLLAVEVPARTAMELLSPRKFMEPLKLLKIKNLYGNHTWAGDWSAKSPLWNKDIRRYLGATQLDDTVTWMTMQDFISEYDTICTTQNFPSAPWVYYDTLLSCPEGHTPLHADQFLITITDPNQIDPDEIEEETCVFIDIYLSQPDKDSVNQDFTDGADLPEVMETFLFKSPDRLHQQCINDNEGEYEVVEIKDEDQYVEDKIPKAPFYLWAPQDMITLTEFPTDSRFVVKRQAKLCAGTYVVVVQQAYHKDALNYCLNVALADPAGTGFTFDVTSIGTLANPRSQSTQPVKR